MHFLVTELLECTTLRARIQEAQIAMRRAADWPSQVLMVWLPLTIRASSIAISQLGNSDDAFSPHRYRRETKVEGDNLVVAESQQARPGFPQASRICFMSRRCARVW